MGSNTYIRGVAFKFCILISNHTSILLDEDFTLEVRDFVLSKLSSMDEITVLLTATLLQNCSIRI